MPAAATHTYLRPAGVGLAVIGLHVSVLALAMVQGQVPVTPPDLPLMQIAMVMEPDPVAAPDPVPPLLRRSSVTPPEARPEPLPLPPAEAPAATPVAVAEPVPVEPPPPVQAPVVPPQVSAAHGAMPPVVYPAISRQRGETGTVLLNLHVLADGRIGDARVLRSSGYPRLDRAAREAALRWRLEPARRGDEPVALWYEWPVRFELD